MPPNDAVLSHVFERSSDQAYLRNPFVLDWHVVRNIELIHHSFYTVAAEDAHEIVFEREEELGRTWVALAASTAAQLVVDTAGLVALSGDHMQASGIEHATKLYIVVRAPRPK